MSALMEQVKSPRSFTLDGSGADNSQSFRLDRADGELCHNPGPVRQAIFKSGTATASSGWRPARFGAPGSDGLDFWPAGFCTIPSPLNDI